MTKSAKGKEIQQQSGYPCQAQDEGEGLCLIPATWASELWTEREKQKTKLSVLHSFHVQPTS